MIFDFLSRNLMCRISARRRSSMSYLASVVDRNRGAALLPPYCVVAESDGCMVGSNCLDERFAIAGLGPITVDPSMQKCGVGRRWMAAVLVRARERNFPGVRLLRSAFHNRSLALYSRLGFDAREPLSVMQGPALRKRIEGCSVRPASVGR
jgi:predicted N-acetyltransferase YhbS